MKTILATAAVLFLLGSHAESAQACSIAGSIRPDSDVACQNVARLDRALGHSAAMNQARANEIARANPDAFDKAAHAIDSLVRIEACLHHAKKSAEGGGVAVDCATIIARSGYAKR